MIIEIDGAVFEFHTINRKKIKDEVELNEHMIQICNLAKKRISELIETNSKCKLFDYSLWFKKIWRPFCNQIEFDVELCVNDGEFWESIDLYKGRFTKPSIVSPDKDKRFLLILENSLEDHEHDSKTNE